MNLYTFALRNLRRNQKRSIITIGGTAFAALIMILYGSLADGMLSNFSDNATAMEMGDLQIHHPKYREESSFYDRVDGESEIIKKLTNGNLRATYRLYAGALAASSTTSVGVQMRGVDPKLESQVTKVHEQVFKGEWISSKDPQGVVIGKVLAKNLAVDLGDEIIILGQAADGSIANELYTVRGVLKAVNAGVDRAGFFMMADSFREVMLMGKGVHEIAVKALDTGMKEPVSLESMAAIAQQAAPDYEVKTWKELNPILAQMIDQSAYSIVFMFLIAYTALGLLLINSSLMSVFERMRELGLIKALGMKPRHIVKLILAEAAWQTLFASVIAVLLAIPAGWYLSVHGIDLSSFSDSFDISGVAMDPVWKAQLNIKMFVQPLLFLFVIILIASLYPAIKAALISPVKSIYDR